MKLTEELLKEFGFVYCKETNIWEYKLEGKLMSFINNNDIKGLNVKHVIEMIEINHQYIGKKKFVNDLKEMFGVL
jgi:hypothetical protein